MGFEIHHGVRNALGGGGKGRCVCVCVCVILYWPANTTREALKAMAGPASLPAPLCGPPSPNVHVAAREGEGEGSLVLAPRRASLFSTEHGSGNGPLCALGLHCLLFGEKKRKKRRPTRKKRRY